MSCRDVEPELVGYHFGVLSEPTRDAVESHLLGCAACLAEYVVLKRAVETGAADERPSDEARARLRRTMERELSPEPRPWGWWERPLAAGVAAAAVAAAIFAVQLVATSEGSAPHAAAIHFHPDSQR